LLMLDTLNEYSEEAQKWVKRHTQLG
jgi:hypothetical protein